VVTGKIRVITKIDEAIDFIFSFVNYEKKSNFVYNTRTFDIIKFQKFLEGLGSPHKKIKTIHVVGTKGKGSTCTILSSILTCAGYKTGSFTSPHLVDIRERIKIDGEMISEIDFTSIVQSLKTYIENNNLNLEVNFRTSFELLTATAFVYFQNKKVDFAVIEAGLGGRLDSTNVIEPDLLIMTSISMDHMNILGETIEKIAFEKAGAIKNSVPVITCNQRKTVEKLLTDICIEKDSPLQILKRRDYIKNLVLKYNGIQFDYCDSQNRLTKLFLPLAGDFQAENALLAIKAFYHLTNDIGPNFENAVRKGLSEVKWRGRLEILSNSPLVIADVAHNPYSIKKLLMNIERIFEYENIRCVLSISSNKNIKDICRILSDYCDDFYVTYAEPTRSSPFEEINTHLSKYPNKITYEQSPNEALTCALRESSPGDLVLITGSIYLVGNLLSYFKQDEK
jgi:dihydrofolate synthase / folylpolyglutamate synthase